MYQALLTRRYLTSKIMPLLAAVAVMLCTAMVLIVWSVMGGFLNMLLASGRTLIGDVAISWPNVGFPHYGALVERLEADPMVEAAAPMIEAYGLINLPDGSTDTVVVKGIEGGSFDRVTAYEQTLWWRPLERPLPKDERAEDPRVPFHDFAGRVVRTIERAELTGGSVQDLAARLGIPAGTAGALRAAASEFIDAAAGRPDVSEAWVSRLGGAAAKIAEAAEGALAQAPTGRPATDLSEHLADLADAGVGFERAKETRARLDDAMSEGMALAMPGAGGDGSRPAAVVGLEVSRYNERRPGGWVDPIIFLPNKEVTLSVMPLDKRGRTIDVEARVFPVVNEFRSGLYEIDANTVFVRLDALQGMLKMGGGGALKAEQAEAFNPFEEPEIAGENPARVTTVLVRAKEGVSPQQLRDRVRAIYGEFAAAHRDVPEADAMERRIVTWEENHKTLINAVKKETALVLFIFGIVSLTAVFLVLAIFWAMVSEKTKDIGILRAVGASRAGVALVWLGYGLVIGVVGSALGGVVALLIIGNINAIHDWLGSALGLYVWDPSVYYFTTIPSEIEPGKAAMVLCGGVLASVLGALVPAVKAAYMDPVKALRFE